MKGRCPTCKEGTLRSADVELKRTFAGHTFVGVVRGDVCNLCDEELVASDELGRFEDALDVALAHARLLDGEALRWMRKAIPLKAIELAELLGTTPETISRWENGKHEVDPAAIAAVAMLVLEKASGRTTLLETLRAPRKVPKRVQLKLKLAS